MSVAAISWVIHKSDLDSPRRLLAIIIADTAGENGLCYLSVETMVKRTRLGERTVRRYLGEFRDSGFISVVEGASQHRPTTYRIQIDQPRPASQAPLRPAPVAPLKAEPGVPERQSRGASGAPKPKEEPKALDLSHPSDSISLPQAAPSLGPLGKALVEAITDALSNGRKSWDLSDTAQRLWDQVIDRKHNGASPGQVLGELVRVVYAEDLDAEDWKRANKLARMYGKTSLRGVVEAIKHDVPLEAGALWQYATAVACKRSEEFRRQREQG